MARNSGAEVDEMTNQTDGSTDNDLDGEGEGDQNQIMVTQNGKRVRVNLDTLSDDTKVLFSIPIPAGLKKALIKAGNEQNLSASTLARNVIAQYMEYSIPETFDQKVRKHKYASEEERKEALAQRGKESRQAVKELLETVDKDPALLAALKERGLNLDILLKGK